MSTRSSSSSSTVLIVLLLIFTFPIWIGLAGGVFGLVAGLMGACIGISAGVFGVIFGILGSIIGAIFGIFGWDSYDWISFPLFHLSGLKVGLVVVIIFAIVMISKSKKKS